MDKTEPRDRIYWQEGVTRSEVMRAMADRRPSPLRRQGPRRLLVLSAAVVMVSLALTVFIGDTKIRTYSEVILMVLGLCLFAFLRQAVRLVSDAPDELLDERQIALRDANYKASYGRIIWLTFAYGALLALFTPGGWLHDPMGDRFWTGIAWSYILCASSLPAMVLAWNLPSEPEEEATGDPADRPSSGPP
jgi:hypothetical protein